MGFHFVRRVQGASEPHIGEQVTCICGKELPYYPLLEGQRVEYSDGRLCERCLQDRHEDGRGEFWVIKTEPMTYFGLSGGLAADIAACRPEPGYEGSIVGVMRLNTKGREYLIQGSRLMAEEGRPVKDVTTHLKHLVETGEPFITKSGSNDQVLLIKWERLDWTPQEEDMEAAEV